jgi:hypothetical protein
MEGLRVVCPICKRRDFVTTDKFDAQKSPNGSMVKCLLPYQIDWLCTTTTRSAEMTCPECCALLAPQGRLTLVMEASRAAEKNRPDAKEQDESAGQGNIKCPVCGRVCKSEYGLKSHMRSHK